jgi:hypothetical protein
MINNKIERFCVITIGLISLMLLSPNVLFSADTARTSLPDSYEGLPVSIGFITSSGGISSTWTYMSILMKKENDKYELIPVSIKTNEPDIAVRLIALINGAIKIEKPAKIYFENSSDGNAKVRAVEANGILINIP